MSREAETEIRRIIEARAAAVNNGDIDAMMKDSADDLVTFDVVDPLRRSGKSAARERANEWVNSYAGPISWNDQDVKVVSGADVAFCFMLSRVRGTLKTGADIDMWFRTTLGLERRNGCWLMTHDHGSVPFNPDSGKASLGLQP